MRETAIRLSCISCFQCSQKMTIISYDKKFWKYEIDEQPWFDKKII